MSQQPAENPFAAPGNWYRGNLHCHTTNSDGQQSPAEAVEWYRSHGYDFLAITDHDGLTDVSSMSDGRFLLLPGLETHPGESALGSNYHLVAIGVSQGFNFTRIDFPVQEAIDRLRADGAIVFLAHPYWSGLTYDEIMPLENIIGLEVFNTVCMQAVGKGYSRVHWDDLLARGRLLWGLATDDTHWVVQASGGGWVMVKATELTSSAIMEALSAGRFYATQGPEIYDLQVSRTEVHIRCSPVARINAASLNGSGGRQLAPSPDQLLNEASISLNSPSRYVRVECTDLQGRSAWAQPICI